MHIDLILEKLERFGISTVSHSQESLLSHLKGTSRILHNWGCSEAICLAGLCHSIYGTESFLKVSATLDNREYVRNLIGTEGEKLAYLFGAHKKESLWKNLGLSDSFCVHDRFTDQQVIISKPELSGMITITLANWLEQRPRAQAEDQFIRLNEFRSSKEFLPDMAYQDFIRAYNLN
ncbi:DUF6817 domain-containing protein [Bdellovibrio sp. HCB337]|uniref:DUF6817 domain-containing protein n=1 Tax=Bdellovibrio sp. HCB337 TaxID=3394358 RepID=UPI0039A7123A